MKFRGRNLVLSKKGVPESIRKINTDLQKPHELGRAVPQPVPGTTLKTSAEGRTEIYTFFTEPGALRTPIYSAEKWVKIRLFLETAGPVAVSTRQDVSPVLSGKGVLLPPGEWTDFTLARGDRLYLAATAVNRVKFVTEPFPWFQSILETIASKA